MTSTRDSVPDIVKMENWDIQYYSGEIIQPQYHSEVFDAGGVAKRVRARHLAVYNNGTSGITLAEFEVYGTGMHSLDNICCNNSNNSYTTSRTKHFPE